MNASRRFLVGALIALPLFDLRGRRLVPTEAALALQRTSHEIFAALERCERALTDCRSGLPAAAQIVLRGGGMAGAAPSHRASATRSARRWCCATASARPRCSRTT